MKRQKIAVWGFLIAGVLYFFAGLRDIFAPGFFNISPQVKTTTDIIFQFVSAASFLALAYLFRQISLKEGNEKK